MKPIHFPGQHPSENVVLLLRRHWSVAFTFISHAIVSAIALPIVIALLFYFEVFTFAPNTLSYILLVEGVSIYYLIAALFYFHNFVDYHLDIWVITDQRIVSIEQNGLFNRTIAELHIEKIQDVSSEVKGKIQTFLDFGQVYIQTAGAIEKFSFEQVPHPAEVAKIILQIHDRLEKTGEYKTASAEDKIAESIHYAS